MKRKMILGLALVSLMVLVSAIPVFADGNIPEPTVKTTITCAAPRL